MCTTPTLSMKMLEQSIYLAGSCENSELDGIRIVMCIVYRLERACTCGMLVVTQGEVKVKKNK